MIGKRRSRVSGTCGDISRKGFLNFRVVLQIQEFDIQQINLNKYFFATLVDDNILHSIYLSTCDVIRGNI